MKDEQIHAVKSGNRKILTLPQTEISPWLEIVSMAKLMEAYPDEIIAQKTINFLNSKPTAIIFVLCLPVLVNTNSI